MSLVSGVEIEIWFYFPCALNTSAGTSLKALFLGTRLGFNLMKICSVYRTHEEVWRSVCVCVCVSVCVFVSV